MAGTSSTQTRFSRCVSRSSAVPLLLRAHTGPAQVSIVPRGVGALGYAQYLPKERFLYTTEQLIDRMCMTLGGRVSEEIFFGRITTGAQDDLQKITRMAFEVCSNYGMSSEIGPLSYRQDQESFTKPFSEQTAQMIDAEVRKMVRTAHERTTQLLTDKKEQVEKVAKLLLDREVITRDDMLELIGPRPFEREDPFDQAMSAAGGSPIEPPPTAGSGPGGEPVGDGQAPAPLGPGIEGGGGVPMVSPLCPLCPESHPRADHRFVDGSPILRAQHERVYVDDRHQD